MQLTIDRFEGDYAVCEKESREMINIPIIKIPAGVKEGNVLIEAKGKFFVDKAETQKNKDEIKILMNDVFE